jgi:hypothetical protein
MMERHRFRSLYAGTVVLLLLLLPAGLAAQNYYFMDAGRVKYGLNNRLNPIKPMARGSDWNTMARGHQFWYPMEEWNSGHLTGIWWSGVLDELLKPSPATTPEQNLFYQLFSRAALGSDNVEELEYVMRHRPSIRLVGLDQIPLQNSLNTAVDITLPTNQTVWVKGPWQDGQTWKHQIWGNENPDLDRSIIHHWEQEYDGRTTSSAGAEKDSTIFLPPGQVLTFWLGHHWFDFDARPTSRYWTGNPWGSNRNEFFHDEMRHPSRLLTPADAARAAELQVFYGYDSWSSQQLDFDGSRLNDTGDPMLGPNIAKSQSSETGEFTSDFNFGSSWFHYDMNGNDPTDRFNLADPSKHAPANFFITRTRGTMWGSADWGGSTGRAAFYRNYGYVKSAMREYYDGAGVNTDGIEWTGFTQASIDGSPEITSGLAAKGGEWAHMGAGPYSLAPGDVHDQVFTLAIGDHPMDESVEMGQRYMKWLSQQKPGVHPNGEVLSVEPLSEVEKYEWLQASKDTLFRVVDQSYYAWSGGVNSGLTLESKIAAEGLRAYPDGPPAPDMMATGGPLRCEVWAWMPDETMFQDIDTGIDDFSHWNIYRKSGRADVGQFNEAIDFGYLNWVLIAQVTSSGITGPGGSSISGNALSTDHYNDEVTFNDGTTRRVMRFFDTSANKGTDYFYAVSAVDDGLQNTTGINPGAAFESDRSQAATGQFGGGIAVTPFSPGKGANSAAGLSGLKPVAGLGVTPYAVSVECSFDIDVGNGPQGVIVSSIATADNVDIYDMVDDIQAAVNAALGSNVVRVTPTRPVGKPTITAAGGSEVLGFETVDTGTEVQLAISNLNEAATMQLGLVAKSIRNKVVVAPNPWTLDAGAGIFSGTDQNKILFDNLPALCKLNIYTETGDLVQTIDHISQSAQEFWYQQTTSQQLVKSGIYILAVINGQEVDPLTNEVIRDVPDQFVKFLIIR